LPNKSVAHFPIALKFGRLVHYEARRRRVTKVLAVKRYNSGTDKSTDFKLGIGLVINMAQRLGGLAIAMQRDCHVF